LEEDEDGRDVVALAVKGADRPILDVPEEVGHE